MKLYLNNRAYMCKILNQQGKCKFLNFKFYWQHNLCIHWNRTYHNIDHTLNIMGQYNYHNSGLYTGSLEGLVYPTHKLYSSRDLLNKLHICCYIIDMKVNLPHNIHLNTYTICRFYLVYMRCNFFNSFNNPSNLWNIIDIFFIRLQNSLICNHILELIVCSLLIHTPNNCLDCSNK